MVAADFAGRVFEFHRKSGARIYHPAPNRCFLVHNIDGKWLYWGKIIVVKQTIAGRLKEDQTTSGEYETIEIYDPEYQRLKTLRESPNGLSYFLE